ncbi:MAG TPA: glycosyl hydrolase [Thermoguttaceae bacterium]|nr:glycosyl hydrolase [Thermoguttaceae bacterium]
MSPLSAKIVRRTAVFLGATLLAAASARAADSSRARELFADPPRQYASAPLWTWNDMLTEEQVRSTLRDLASQKVMQAFVHPRPGLMTPYLSDDWFRLWKAALDEAEKLDMNVWIYDENSYPSGFAGGLVPEALPDSRGKGLHVQEVKKPPKPGDDVLAVFRLSDDGYENVTKAARAGEEMPEGRYLVASIRLAPEGGWFGGKWYVDLIKPGVTEKFIEITMEAYRREIGDQFGKRVPGWFTDEPHLAPAGGLHWSDGLPELFQKRWGYDLVEHLPCLVRPVGDWKRVRHNYYGLLLEQFIEHWAKPCYEYCEKHGLEFTGHYWEHGWPGAGHGGDNMAMYAWHQRPSIDILMNQYKEDVHAQFGNVRACLELQSVANQLGCERTLCEAYGAGGWDLRFEDMKRIGDWIYVLGVNTLDEHLSYITLRGARKRDHPQSFSYHEPWWEAYHVMAEYFTRLSLALTEGEQINHILLIEPTTTAWMYQGDAHLNEIGDTFQGMVTTLAKEQVEFDLGCEDIIARNGSVDGAELVVGQRRYHTVVLPPLAENLNAKTMDLLESYLAEGGTVIACGPPPAFVDGAPSERGSAVSARPGWRQIDPSLAGVLMAGRAADGFVIRPRSSAILFHHRRKLDDGEILFLVNTSIDRSATGVISSKAQGVEQWRLDTGEITGYPFARPGEGVKFRYDLPPCGSLLLFLANEPREPASPDTVAELTIPAAGPMEIRRLEPNVLTLDHMDVTAGGETKKDLYFFQAAQFVFQKHGLDGNPWERAVQLRDQLITKKFPPESGFEATYRFTIEGQVPNPLAIVIERPDLYTITCNGKPVAAKQGDWWLDKSFGRIDVSSAAQPGENAVTIKASPFTIWHELEPAYVLGNFALKPADQGFVIAPDRPLRFARRLAHDNPVQGTMWLSAGIGFGRDPAAETGNDGDPFLVFDLGKPYELRAIEVWNYNEVNLTERGVKEIAIAGSATGEPDSFTVPVGTFELARANGTPAGLSQILEVKAPGVRFVQFDVLSNQRGVTYPTTDGSQDNAFVGLSEVRFLGAPETDAKTAPIPGVKLHAFSSALAGREARLVLDGSGLRQAALGWDRQGQPFYGAGVGYRQKFSLSEPKGRYVVALGNWLGSVAKVLVDGRQAGYIASQPWQLDVTDSIKPGENTIEVVVIGTLKNTLGPHHAGALRGAAWPHMFQRGPETGPPPGASYDTISYGLFEPFVLKQGR